MQTIVKRLIVAIMALTIGHLAMPAQAQGQGQYYARQQIERDLAPIALYPDQLLSQILMAATYPLEVSEAADWVRDPRNAGLSGDQLAAALDDQDWDPSVKALVQFPDVLNMLNSQPDWMERLGEEFLAQENDVMDSVQRLRSEASAAGTLRSDSRLAVRNVGPAIIIEPAQPDLVYVPYYDPRVAYGDWDYPDYPPLYFPPPPGYSVSIGTPFIGLTFVAPRPIYRPYWGWSNWDWGGRRIVIERDRYIVLNRNRPPRFAGNNWEHDWYHRRGAMYRAPEIRQRFDRGDFGQRDIARDRRYENAARAFDQRSAQFQQRRDRDIVRERRQFVDVQRRVQADRSRGAEFRDRQLQQQQQRFDRGAQQREQQQQRTRDRDVQRAEQRDRFQQQRDQRQVQGRDREQQQNEQRNRQLEQARERDQQRDQQQGRNRFQQQREEQQQQARERQQQQFQQRQQQQDQARERNQQREQQQQQQARERQGQQFQQRQQQQEQARERNQQREQQQQQARERQQQQFQQRQQQQEQARDRNQQREQQQQQARERQQQQFQQRQQQQEQARGRQQQQQQQQQQRAQRDQAQQQQRAQQQQAQQAQRAQREQAQAQRAQQQQQQRQNNRNNDQDRNRDRDRDRRNGG